MRQQQYGDMPSHVHLHMHMSLTGALQLRKSCRRETQWPPQVLLSRKQGEGQCPGRIACRRHHPATHSILLGICSNFLHPGFCSVHS